MSILQFVYPFTGWQVADCFQFLAITNQVAVRICVQALVWIYAFLKNTRYDKSLILNILLGV